MTDNHYQSFFGQSAALFVKSSSKSDDFIFLQCIKRKGGKVWEKPSQGEGKNVKISLGEIVMILKVLARERDSWSTYHNYQEGTSISFNWHQEAFWVKIGEYVRKLGSPDIEIFSLLLQHLLEEKIAFATGSRPSKPSPKPRHIPSSNKGSHPNPPARVDLLSSDLFDGSKITTPSAPSRKSMKRGHSHENARVIVKQETVRSPQPSPPQRQAPSGNGPQTPKDAELVEGTIQRETEKALMIMFKNGVEAWVPKSTVHGEYDYQNGALQSFRIQTWVLKSKNVIS